MLEVALSLLTGALVCNKNIVDTAAASIACGRAAVGAVVLNVM